MISLWARLSEEWLLPCRKHDSLQKQGHSSPHCHRERPGLATARLLWPALDKDSEGAGPAPWSESWPGWVTKNFDASSQLCHLRTLWFEQAPWPEIFSSSVNEE